MKRGINFSVIAGIALAVLAIVCFIGGFAGCVG